MGCDIHSHAEKQESGRWVSLDVEAFDASDYGFFGWLAGGEGRLERSVRRVVENREEL